MIWSPTTWRDIEPRYQAGDLTSQVIREDQIQLSLSHLVMRILGFEMFLFIWSFFSPCRYWISNVVVFWGESNLLERDSMLLCYFISVPALQQMKTVDSSQTTPRQRWQNPAGPAKKKSIMNSKNKIEATTNSLMLTCFNCSSNVSKVRGPCDVNDSRCVLKGKKEQSVPLV